MVYESLNGENLSMSTIGANIIDNLGIAMRENLCPKNVEMHKSYLAERTFDSPFKNFNWINNEDDL